MNKTILTDPDITGISVANSKQSVNIYLNVDTLQKTKDNEGESLICLSAQDVQVLATLVNLSPSEDFNAAINFTLDKAEGEGLLFLQMWREGDWGGIDKEFPDFHISHSLRNPNQQGGRK